MVPEAGHYPQSQQPDITTGAVLRFLESVNGPSQDRAHPGHQVRGGRANRRRGNPVAEPNVAAGSSLAPAAARTCGTVTAVPRGWLQLEAAVLPPRRSGAAAFPDQGQRRRR
jgi:hypothetical protein